jgi:hypothetical protein
MRIASVVSACYTERWHALVLFVQLQVTIHTDTLNESCCVEGSVAAFKGRTIHAYHSEVSLYFDIMQKEVLNTDSAVSTVRCCKGLQSVLGYCAMLHQCLRTLK